MGALTLKQFPFEYRGWDAEYFKSLDPTDGFGANTRAYLIQNQIVLIEPNYNLHTFNKWLNDKSRQFFDGIFDLQRSKYVTNNKLLLKKNLWTGVFKIIKKKLYIFDHFNTQKIKKHFFTIIFENLSIEVLSLLTVISQNYSFIKLKRIEKITSNNDLESHFQLNLASNKFKLNFSTLCLLFSTNSRYEGSSLNLNLRQRFFKGNYKCLTIGPIADLTFPVSVLGSNIITLKSITCGNYLTCQDIKFSKKPLLIYNSELLKRFDGINTLTMLKYFNFFNSVWGRINSLAPSLSETGTQNITNFLSLSEKDLTNFSLLYFLNISPNNVSNLKRITETKLLNYFSVLNENISQNTTNKIVINQNSSFKNNNIVISEASKILKSQYSKNYFYLPANMFYENEETFVNTEGLIKRTNKLIFKKDTKNNWQILRKFFKKLKFNVSFLNTKDNQLINFNFERLASFKSFVYFQYTAAQSLTNFNFYLKNKPFAITFNSNLKQKQNKILNTKTKYWLDDFFNDSKDEYSQNSLILTNCSRILRAESANFF